MNKATFRTAYLSISQVRRFAIYAMEASDNSELDYICFRIGQLADYGKKLLQELNESSSP